MIGLLHLYKICGNINRITVEFKLSLQSPRIMEDMILIESQWNLNYKHFVSFTLSENILIESQWNLNKNHNRKTINT